MLFSAKLDFIMGFFTMVKDNIKCYQMLLSIKIFSLPNLEILKGIRLSIMGMLFFANLEFVMVFCNGRGPRG